MTTATAHDPDAEHDDHDAVRRAELAALARRVSDRDPGAEADLVERFHRGVGYMLRRWVGDPALAEDLTQETFRVAIESLRRGGLDETSRLDAYVRGVARNLARNETRKIKRRGPVEPLRLEAPLADHAPDPLTAAVAAETRRAVHRVLDELSSSRDRHILRGHYLVERPRDEVCQDLGIEPRTYYVVLHRARRRFRALLERLARSSSDAEVL